MAYDTTATIIAAACAECGLTAVADPFAATSDEQVQLRNLLNQCGRELYAMPEGGWQQFVKTHTIDTTSSPVADGRYDLPSDFGFMLNQTGWTPTNAGMGLPVSILTEQQYAALVATNSVATLIYVSFLFQEGQIQVLPAPAPADIDITFQYHSNAWAVSAASVPLSRCTASDDVVWYEPILISTMLALRYKQAKGLEASALEQRFQNLYQKFTGVNRPAKKLSLVNEPRFPYLNPWTNVPQTGFGS